MSNISKIKIGENSYDIKDNVSGYATEQYVDDAIADIDVSGGSEIEGFVSIPYKAFSVSAENSSSSSFQLLSEFRTELINTINKMLLDGNLKCNVSTHCTINNTHDIPITFFIDATYIASNTYTQIKSSPICNYKSDYNATAFVVIGLMYTYNAETNQIKYSSQTNWFTQRFYLGIENSQSYTPTSNYHPSTKLYTDKTHYENMAGYDATKTQVLKNINGVLTWVDEA